MNEKKMSEQGSQKAATGFYYVLTGEQSAPLMEKLEAWQHQLGRQFEDGGPDNLVVHVPKLQTLVDGQVIDEKHLRVPTTFYPVRNEIACLIGNIATFWTVPRDEQHRHFLLEIRSRNDGHAADVPYFLCQAMIARVELGEVGANRARALIRKPKPFPTGQSLYTSGIFADCFHITAQMIRRHFEGFLSRKPELALQIGRRPQQHIALEEDAAMLFYNYLDGVTLKR
jgi:hypothetical protein